MTLLLSSNTIKVFLGDLLIVFQRSMRFKVKREKKDQKKTEACVKKGRLRFY